MKEVYFDNSATTPLLPSVIEKMNDVMVNHFGNPSSVHSRGTDAEKIVSEARKQVISALGVKNEKSGTLYFTSCGTEADNMAITGTLKSKNFRYRPRIITTDSEHPAVLNPISEAEKNGAEVIRLSTKNGIIVLDEYRKMLTPQTVLVSVMRVNNETGAVYPVAEMFGAAKEMCPDVVTHCDAVQGFCKIPCVPQKLNADLVSVSAHKIGGPKGMGALWCDSALITRKRITPIIYGGGQEGGYRSGTENVIGIAGFGNACAMMSPEMNTNYNRVCELRDYLISRLPSDVIVNQPMGEYLPNIISLTVPSVKSEVLVRKLSLDGVMISAGSACSAKKLKTSSVLTAFGLEPNIADSTVRVSISSNNTPDEADIFISSLTDAIKQLQKKR